MAGISYLMRRGGTYSARVRIPKVLVDFYRGKREIVRALGTTGPAGAKRRLHPVVAVIQREFDDLRARSVIRTQDFGAPTWARYTAALQADDDTRMSLPDRSRDRGRTGRRAGPYDLWRDTIGNAADSA